MAVYPEFQGKVAIITGGGGGIGKATGLKVGQNGCRVFVADITDEIVNNTVEYLKSEGVEAAGKSVDVTDEASVEAMVQACIDAFGRVDYLVNAAGIYKHVLLKDMTYDEWKETINININGTFLCTRKVINYMLDQGYGSIVNFSSQAGVRGSMLHTHYSATKAAMQGFTRALMYEVSDKGVRVNCVAPGVIETRMTITATEEKKKKWMDSIAMKRIGKPSEAASTIAWLLSDDASYITGQTIPISGGSIVNT